MLSSTFNSEKGSAQMGQAEMYSSQNSKQQTMNPPAQTAAHAPSPGLRLTASDRPGMAQPVPERDIPTQPWRLIAAIALLLNVLLLAAWEWHWRAYGAVPGYRNSDAHWAEQRRRIDQGEGNKTVLIGSSRVLFDVQLPVWRKTTGTAPIQLALEGTSPMSVLEDLANDQDFTGQLLVGVTPGLFFTGREARASVIPYYHNQGPSQRSGHWLSQLFIEPYAAFYDPDFALAKVVQRLPWPKRPGLETPPPVRKLMIQGEGRNSHMWHKVETDPDYQAMARAVWLARQGKPMEPAKAKAMIEAQIARAVAAIAKLRARGVRVVFLRAPSLDPLYAGEERDFPRAASWDLLLSRTGMPGIHFMDHPQLQGYVLPEWSHLSAAEADRFTAALVPLVEQNLETK